MIKTFSKSFLQYKHFRRYMENLETTFFNIDHSYEHYKHYKHFRRIRQENDHKIKQSFCNEPCIEPYKQYKQKRQWNDYWVSPI